MKHLWEPFQPPAGINSNRCSTAHKARIKQRRYPQRGPSATGPKPRRHPTAAVKGGDLRWGVVRKSLREIAQEGSLSIDVGSSSSRWQREKLAAKDRAAAMASSAYHRRASANVTAARVATGAARARDLRSGEQSDELSKVRGPPPPNLKPRTTSGHGLPCSSSGQVRALARSAPRKAAGRSSSRS